MNSSGFQPFYERVAERLPMGMIGPLPTLDAGV